MRMTKYWTSFFCFGGLEGQRMLRARGMDSMTGGALALAQTLDIHDSTMGESASKMRCLGGTVESPQGPATGL